MSEPDPGNPNKSEKTLTSETSSTTKRENLTALANAIRCAEIADEFRARDIIILDLTAVTPEFDYFVIATGSSRRQMHAVVEEVDRVMKSSGARRIGVEGYNENQWILQDYGDVVLHIFDEETRSTYDLERLWGDAKRVDWQPSVAAASPNSGDASAE